ncbi:MAG: 1-acyl-sn-glycerol-3-phosphate acyltransferase [Ferruginibacter sp.]
MLYRLLYLPAKLAIWIFCRHISINNISALNLEGPLLIAANHPNSFLDAIIISTLFKRPVYSLARGDAFTKPLYKKLLYSLNMFPVYRMSEGAHNLESNYETFENCKDIFNKNGIVLIFSEGRCVNEWALRPLKKGTARLAQSSWEEGIPLKILPTGINYSSFTRFGKNIQLNFGNMILESDLKKDEGYGRMIIEFNDKLNHELKKLVVEVKPAEKEKLAEIFLVPQPFLKKIVLAIPAFIGYIIHAPVYIPLQKYAWKTAKHIDHYDSVMIGLLFFLYLPYLLLIGGIINFIFGGMWWILILLLPFCAWSFVQVKGQF